jgi:hypothetical protein
MGIDGSQIQNAIYLAGETPWPVGAEAWAARAQEVLEAGPFGYIAGGAGNESTLRANREAFERRRLRPRMLTGNAERDASVDVLGTPSPVPFFLAPIGVLSIAHAEGELAAARAAAGMGIPFILSSAASHSIEEIAEAMGDAPRWFQLYWVNDREICASFVSRAEAAGYAAIVVTLDTLTLGWRPRDPRNAYLPFLSGQGCAQFFSDPVFCSRLEQTSLSSGASTACSRRARLTRPVSAQLAQMFAAAPITTPSAMKHGADHATPAAPQHVDDHLEQLLLGTRAPLSEALEFHRLLRAADVLAAYPTVNAGRPCPSKARALLRSARTSHTTRARPTSSSTADVMYATTSTTRHRTRQPTAEISKTFPDPSVRITVQAPDQRENPPFPAGFLWAHLGSNQGPPACEAGALPLTYAPRGRHCRAIPTKRTRLCSRVRS